MVCYSPLTGVIRGILPSGKKDIQIVPHYFGMDDALCKVHPIVSIPCGQCFGCRLDKSREWAVRMMMELNYHDSAYFLTLTYNDEYIKTNEDSDMDTLCKADLQKFFKRLRMAVSRKYKKDGRVVPSIRYYASGEYGTDSFRPHYHAIVFGLELDDLKYYMKSPLGDSYYNSEFLSKIWPLGFVVVGEVTMDSCGYVARYVTKKLNGAKASFYQNHNVEPEFSIMSTKPAIGSQYMRDHLDDMVKYHVNYISTESGAVGYTPPRYFRDRLFPQETGSSFERPTAHFKQQRFFKLTNTDKYDNDLLSVEREAHFQRAKILKRRDI